MTSQPSSFLVIEVAMFFTISLGHPVDIVLVPALQTVESPRHGIGKECEECTCTPSIDFIMVCLACSSSSSSSFLSSFLWSDLLSPESSFFHVLSLPLDQQQRPSLHRHDTSERDRTPGVSLSSSRDRDMKAIEITMSKKPSSAKQGEAASLTSSARKEERERRNNYGPSGDSQESSIEDQVLHKLVQQGSSDSAKIKIDGLRKFTEAKENLSRLRQDAAKKCREGKKEMCESPEKPLAKTLNITLPGKLKRRTA